MHPLFGCDAATFARALTANGGVSARHLPRTAGIAAGILARTPVSLAERAVMAGQIRRADMPPPIFIVGHWRSGTTHLYNIMSRGGFGYVSPLAAGLPWDMFGIAAALRPALEAMLPARRFIDDIPVRPDSPQEDEVPMANMTDLSFYHGLYFPKNFENAFNRAVFFDGCSPAEIERWTARLDYFLRKVWLIQGRRPLLIKNPAYTARLGLLARLYPGARFIHIVRSPYEVFVSMRNFYAKLFEQLALNRYDHIDIDTFILRTYNRLLDRSSEEAAGLGPGRYVELRYEDLEARPLDTVARAYDELRLEGFDDARPDFATYLDSVRDYRKNRFTLDAATIDRINRECAGPLARWGHAAPEPAAAE
ncbi:MAG: sulfotransferase [Azospirillaceae bacterium]